MGSGQWAVGSGQWAVGSGQWAVGSGQWAVGSGQFLARNLSCQLQTDLVLFIVSFSPCFHTSESSNHIRLPTTDPLLPPLP
ncbi:hypothetical protein D5085_10555 [Ectothiorhodospiraceae bacterium BW-2]|nr:hypothetical protein D5085_10555 [Ectothiorhodospiraceae bacterium BW-2]